MNLPYPSSLPIESVQTVITYVRSGLAEAEHALAGVEGIAFLHFQKSDIVRHPVVGRIVEAYERHRA